MNDFTLHLGDCIQGMAAMEDRSVDHILTDPPYAPMTIKNARSATMIKRRDGKLYDFGYSALSPELRAACSTQFARLAKRWIVVWCDIESTEAWRRDLEAAGLRYVRTGVWVRVNGCPQFSGDRPAQGVEACVIMHTASRMRWNGGGRPAVWTGPIVNSRDGERIHASPKPLWLMREIVRDFTESDELILDPFSGSASMGVAALEFGRRFLGWEISAEYHAAASARLVDAQRQEHLFRAAPMVQQKLM